MNPWDTARNWVRARLIYPQNHPQMGWILNHMSKVKIKKADVLPKGTQLKMLLYLEGNQKESVFNTVHPNITIGLSFQKILLDRNFFQNLFPCFYNDLNFIRLKYFHLKITKIDEKGL